jgi:hypothetical protein
MNVDSRVRSDTTIRISKATRDAFAAEASGRHISMAALLDDIAAQLKRERLFSEAREAARFDDDNPEWAAERDLWEQADADGIA